MRREYLGFLFAGIVVMVILMMTDAPVNAPVNALAFDADYQARYLCVDNPTHPAGYFDGGETLNEDLVARAVDGATVTYSLAAVPDSLDYALFTIDGDGRVSVSRVGADEHTGLRADRLYFFKVVGDDGSGGKGETHVAAQVVLDMSLTGDGGCAF